MATGRRKMSKSTGNCALHSFRGHLTALSRCSYQPENRFYSCPALFSNVFGAASPLDRANPAVREGGLLPNYNDRLPQARTTFALCERRGAAGKQGGKW